MVSNYGRAKWQEALGRTALDIGGYPVPNSGKLSPFYRMESWVFSDYPYRLSVPWTE
jgi:hypothetical protein